MKPLSPYRTINRSLAAVSAALLTVSALAVLPAWGEESEEDVTVGALVQFLDVDPSDQEEPAASGTPAPVVNADHVQQLPRHSDRVIYRITSEPARQEAGEPRGSGRVHVRISSKNLEQGAADVDAAPGRERLTRTARFSDRVDNAEEPSQLVGYQATLRVHVKKPKSATPTSRTEPAVDNLAPAIEDVSQEQPLADDRKRNEPLNDYRLASEAHSLVLLVEPNVLDVLEEGDAEKAQQGAESPGGVEPASDSLIVYAQPPQEGGLESIASMRVDQKELKKYGLRPIGQVGVDIRPEVGELPTDYAAPLFARVGEIRQPIGATRGWGMYAMNWEAKGLCYGPLRFEEVNLERYGYAVPLVQPALSAAHFFGTLPMLPYKMAATSRWNCQYSLGHYRPGNFVPFRYNRTPLRLSAGAVEAAAAAGAILVFP